MSPDENYDSQTTEDEDFLEVADKLRKLEDDLTSNISNEDDYDFDGQDTDLSDVPSWIDEETDEKSGEKLDEKAIDTPELFEQAELTNPGDLSAAIEQRDSYLAALRQLQADFENYKKRVIRDQQEYAEMKNVKLMEELLPIVDNFNLAMNSLDSDNKEVKKLRKGIELVYSELFALLERQGLERIDAQDALFDPELHDAVMHEDNGEHDEEIVTEVLREGYKVRGRVVRPAMVKVAK